MFFLEIAHGHEKIFVGGLAGVVGDLRFVTADEIGGGVDEGFVEFENRVFLSADARRELVEVGVESHADERF